VLLPCWWPSQTWGSPSVGSDTWLSQECFYTPSVGSSPVVCSRYSSRVDACLQHQARLTTCDQLQCSRMRSYDHHSCSWRSSSDQVCPLSAMTLKLSDEHLCSFATPGELGATRSKWTWSVVRVYDRPCRQSCNYIIHQHAFHCYSAN